MSEIGGRMGLQHQTGSVWWESLAAFFTDAGVGVLYAALAVCWWRARRLPSQDMARAVLAPLGVLATWLISSGLKLLVAAERPCQTPAVRALVDCPPAGDWSFPSNHAALAAACAVGIACAWRVLAVPAGVLAVAVAASRVVVGVHYPLDVVAGLLVGSATAAAVVLGLSVPATRTINRFRAHPRLKYLVADSPVDDD